MLCFPVHWAESRRAVEHAHTRCWYIYVTVLGEHNEMLPRGIPGSTLFRSAVLTVWSPGRMSLVSAAGCWLPGRLWWCGRYIDLLRLEVMTFYLKFCVLHYCIEIRTSIWSSVSWVIQPGSRYWLVISFESPWQYEHAGLFRSPLLKWRLLRVRGVRLSVDYQEGFDGAVGILILWDLGLWFLHLRFALLHWDTFEYKIECFLSKTTWFSVLIGNLVLSHRDSMSMLDYFVHLYRSGGCWEYEVYVTVV